MAAFPGHFLSEFARLSAAHGGHRKRLPHPVIALFLLASDLL
jgi:hypothetical protein